MWNQVIGMVVGRVNTGKYSHRRQDNDQVLIKRYHQWIKSLHILKKQRGEWYIVFQSNIETKIH